MVVMRIIQVKKSIERASFLETRKLASKRQKNKLKKESLFGLGPVF